MNEFVHVVGLVFVLGKCDYLGDSHFESGHFLSLVYNKFETLSPYVHIGNYILI